MIKDNPKFLVVDLFCGFGGTSTGFERTNGIAKVIACINHDPKAIKSHWLNYPEIKHFEEDVRTVNIVKIARLVNYNRRRYPDAKVILWASLECTNFSKAKGGQPRNADSRTLANSLFMSYDTETNEYYNKDSYIQLINPDYIMIENVTEFLLWGPLDENGKPTKKGKGEDFIQWNKNIENLGYKSEWVKMNSADYGAYTSRTRLFGCFAKEGLPIVFPEPTHSKKETKGKKPYKAVKKVLDFSIEGKSIINRNKPLVEATLKRIYGGLTRFIDNKAFIDNYYGKGYCTSIDTPAPTIRTKDGMSLIQVEGFIYRDFKTETNSSLEKPVGSITTVPKMSLVRVERFLVNPQFSNTGSSIEKPCFTLIAKMDKRPPSLVEAFFTEDKPTVKISRRDSPMTKAIKKYMIENNITDITQRMLVVPELLKIQGFSEDYKYFGNQADAKKFVGNSVVPNVVTAWALELSKKF